MQQRQHRQPARHLPDLSRRRHLWLVPTTRSRLHSRRHRPSPGFRPRPTLRRIPSPSPTATTRHGRAGADHHSGLRNGPRLHDRCLPRNFRVCT